MQGHKMHRGVLVVAMFSIVAVFFGVAAWKDSARQPEGPTEEVAMQPPAASAPPPSVPTAPVAQDPAPQVPAVDRPAAPTAAAPSQPAVGPKVSVTTRTIPIENPTDGGASAGDAPARPSDRPEPPVLRAPELAGDEALPGFGDRPMETAGDPPAQDSPAAAMAQPHTSEAGGPLAGEGAGVAPQALPTIDAQTQGAVEAPRAGIPGPVAGAPEQQAGGMDTAPQGPTEEDIAAFVRVSLEVFARQDTYERAAARARERGDGAEAQALHDEMAGEVRAIVEARFPGGQAGYRGMVEAMRADAALADRVAALMAGGPKGP